MLIEQKLPAGKAMLYGRHYGLPGDLVRGNEHFDTCAMRVVRGLTSQEDIFLEQFHAFGEPDNASKQDSALGRMPEPGNQGSRAISLGYYCLVRLTNFKPSPTFYSLGAEWVPVSKLPPLKFNQNRIIKKALQTLQYKTRVEPIAFELLPQKFTLGQLQSVYEAILGSVLDKRNFRRKILSRGILAPLEEKQKGVPHKPAMLYQFDSEGYMALKGGGFDFLL
jgi:8-oxo-dGTP diphosphatase